MVSKLIQLSTHHSLLTNKGWKHTVELQKGIEKMYEWYLEVEK